MIAAGMFVDVAVEGGGPVHAAEIIAFDEIAVTLEMCATGGQLTIPRHYLLGIELYENEAHRAAAIAKATA